ncbi:hypothetical protein DFH28DRAFT_90385 [Melampsora americana]|nr:hypothetical protein DFH28DRAFT_90385 [Melampsora americana]
MNHKNTIPSNTLSVIKNLNYQSSESCPLQSLNTQASTKREERAWRSNTFGSKAIRPSISLSAHEGNPPESPFKASLTITRPRRNSSFSLKSDPETNRLSYSTNESQVQRQTSLRGSPILTDGLSSMNSQLPTENSSDDTFTLKLLNKGTVPSGTNLSSTQPAITLRKDTLGNDVARRRSYSAPRNRHTMRLALGLSWPCQSPGVDLWHSPNLSLDPSDNPSLSFPLPPKRVSLQFVTRDSESLAQDVPLDSVQSLRSRSTSSSDLRTRDKASLSEPEREVCDPYLVLGDQLAHTYLGAILQVPDETSTLKIENQCVEADDCADLEGSHTTAVNPVLPFSLKPTSPTSIEKNYAIRQSVSFSDDSLHIQSSSENESFCFSGILPSVNLSPMVNYTQSSHSVQGSIGSNLLMDDALFWSTDLRTIESQTNSDFPSELCSWVSSGSHIDSTEGEILRQANPRITDREMWTSTTPVVSEGSIHRGICGTRMISATPTLQSDIKIPDLTSVSDGGLSEDQVTGLSQKGPYNFTIGLGLEDQQIRRRKNLQAVLGSGFHMNMLQPDILKSEALTEKAPLRNPFSFWTRKVHSTPKKLKKMKTKTVREHQLKRLSTLDYQISGKNDYHLSFPGEL